MEGIYIHIPFCRQACRYCDFYFTVAIQNQDRFTGALLRELEIRRFGQEEKSMGSLYFGGGTPSLLSSENLKKIMKGVKALYAFSEGAEITIECNPDDLDATKLQELRSIGFNRISIGIQSFHEEDLILMRRSHSAVQADRAVRDAASAGFGNITVDLIYGIPGQDKRGWRDNIQRVLELPVQHIAAYHLSFETGTVFDHWRKKGRIMPVSEDESVKMYRLLREELLRAGFEHYEISNFAKDGWRSQHNQLYWSGESYHGFGPSAHSFRGSTRYWNIASIKKYMEFMEEGKSISEKEELNAKESYHDYLITSLRTSQGADSRIIEQRFGQEVWEHFRNKVNSFEKDGLMMDAGKNKSIHPDSWLLADHIMRELFLD